MHRKNVLRLVCCFVGAVIGAGFASGQELLTFFVRYGTRSFLPLVLAGALFGIYGVVMLRNIHLRNAQSLTGYFSGTAGRGICAIMETVVYAFMFASFCVMVSGTGALLQQAFNLPLWVGATGMAALCFVLFCCGAQGVVHANTVLTPLLILGMLAVAIPVLLGSQPAFLPFENQPVAAFSSALLYVSYNTLTLIAVFLPLRHLIDSGRTAIASGIISGAILSGLLVILWLLLQQNFELVSSLEIPMLAIAQQTGRAARPIYSVVLLLAMITTAVSSGFGFLCRINHALPRPALAAILCGVSIPLAFVGFSRLVEYLYTFFGYAGLFLFFYTLLDGLPRKNHPFG
ncbi:MAG: hypothetical protein E7409_07465 [Ruminococcaceae bacterium]|nr:hypothetical protein [Oscillospiraceae bacterium]